MKGFSHVIINLRVKNKENTWREIMKKILALLLVFVLSFSVLAGCAPTETPVEEPTEEPMEEPVEEPSEEPTEEPSAEMGTITKLGLGHIISIEKSTDKADDKTAKAQADVTIMAVGFDMDGKVVSAELDVAQTAIEFDENMALATDTAGEFKTKKELGEDYGMVKASAIGKEWFEQAQALEEWMVGKTVDEITGMEIVDGASAEEDLVSSVTIGVETYLAALEQAWEEAIEVDGAETVGLGVKTSIAKSKSAEADKGALAQVDTIIAATAFDADNKVAGTVIDTAQVKINYDVEGKVETDKTMELKTKNELGADYGMAKASEIGKEWFEQARALGDWMVGKTVEEITSIELEDGVAIDEDLVSSVTIGVADYLYVVEESAQTAK